MTRDQIKLGELRRTGTDNVIVIELTRETEIRVGWSKVGGMTTVVLERFCVESCTGKGWVLEISEYNEHLLLRVKQSHGLVLKDTEINGKVGTEVGEGTPKSVNSKEVLKHVWLKTQPLRKADHLKSKKFQVERTAKTLRKTKEKERERHNRLT